MKRTLIITIFLLLPQLSFAGVKEYNECMQAGGYEHQCAPHLFK